MQRSKSARSVEFLNMFGDINAGIVEAAELANGATLTDKQRMEVLIDINDYLSSYLAWVLAQSGIEIETVREHYQRHVMK